MDIDIDEVETSGILRGSSTRRLTMLTVDDAHPFDLEAYISGYNGRGAVQRLIHLIPMAPSIAHQAVVLGFERIKQLRDTSLCKGLQDAYAQASTLSDSADSLPPFSAIATIDQTWIDEINSKNSAEKTKLEVELKTYMSNMIKESIRMALRDLAEHCRAVGDHQSAIKYYAKLREFCSTSQHVLDMCIAVLEVLIEQRNYAHIPTYVFKAEPALDATTNSLRNANQGPTATTAPPNKEKIAAEREKFQTKLELASALSYLGSGSYEKAAQHFMKMGSIKGLGDWAGKVVAPSDIAIYGALCALATFSRSSLKNTLTNNNQFGVYLEQEPYVRELLEAYMASRFKIVLEILERNLTRHFVDIHLASHVPTLTHLIRNRALVLYFKPFTSIKLERMGAAFGWSAEYLEEQVIHLIQSGEISARVDKQNKILKAKETDQRTVLYARALKAGADMQSANRKLLLRMRLLQADLIVKAPKPQQQTQLPQTASSLSDYYHPSGLAGMSGHFDT